MHLEEILNRLSTQGRWKTKCIRLMLQISISVSRFGFGFKPEDFFSFFQNKDMHRTDCETPLTIAFNVYLPAFITNLQTSIIIESTMTLTRQLLMRQR